MNISTPSIERAKASQVVPLQIAAGGRETIRATGSHFFVIDTPVRVKIRMDSTPECDYGAGCGLDMEGVFEWIEVRNPTASTINVLIYVGFAKYEDKRHTVQDTPSIARGSGVVTIAGGATLDFTGVPVGKETQRKCLIVSNMDAAAYLEVQDGAGQAFMAIEPKSSVELRMSGPLKLYNENGAAVQCRVGEIFYIAGA